MGVCVALFAASPVLLEALRSMSDGLEDIRKRGAIPDENDGQWVDEALIRARAIISNAI